MTALITKNKSRQENKIPWLGDLPFIGSLFCYRTQNQSRRELLVIMTPHIVRCEADANRILLDEIKRMDWVLRDVEAVHGTGRSPLPPGGPVPQQMLMPNPGVMPNTQILPQPSRCPPARALRCRCRSRRRPFPAERVRCCSRCRPSGHRRRSS